MACREGQRPSWQVGWQMCGDCAELGIVAKFAHITFQTEFPQGFFESAIDLIRMNRLAFLAAPMNAQPANEFARNHNSGVVNAQCVWRPKL